jgi:rod shape-determining protein MreD
MRRSSLWLFVLLLLILDLTLFRKIEVWRIRPDATALIIVYVALALGSTAGCLFGFLVGLAKLAILSTSMASMPLAATVVGFLVGKYATKIMYESYLVQMVIVFVGVLILDVINFAWASPGGFATGVFRFSLGTAAYTAVIGVAIVALLERVVGLRLVT